MSFSKPHLTFGQIVNMNFGFFGLQYSFGLQQANMSPIYSYLGADESPLPLLWLAGPMTGLIVQPIIGALSDKTITRWGRRTPYFLIGAVLCSLSLLVMPFSSSVWMAASILWILDAANNVTQEPYRAFVSDKLDKSQHSFGFLTQSAFTGLGQTLSYLTPFLLINFFAISESGKIGRIPTSTLPAFLIGGVVSISSIMWTLKTTKEIPLTEEEKAKIRASPSGVASTFSEIFEAMREMPMTMKLMAPMMLFSWYGMFIYWQYIAMGNPYIMLAGSIPAERTGVYMGIFNMFIVIPMLLETFTMPLYYKAWLGNNPVNAIKLAGVLLILAAFSVLFIKVKKGAVVGETQLRGGGH